MNEKIKSGEKINSDERIVVVSTQIVEASVNVDFDILINEISTIDSQVQRWGRIYRNRDSDYKDEKPNIIIFSKTDKFTNSIYDKDVVEKTNEVLKEIKINAILDYSSERELIERVFEKEIDGKSLTKKYVEEIEKNLEYLKFFTVEKKSQAQKLFRTLAGNMVVIPQIMELDETDNESALRKSFAKIIKDTSNKETWEQIVDKIFQETGFKVDKEQMKWKLKQLLYDYSVNVPIYAFEKYRNLFSKEFKGFHIIKENLDIKDSEVIKEKGIDSFFKDVDVDELYLKEVETII